MAVFLTIVSVVLAAIVLRRVIRQIHNERSFASEEFSAHQDEIASLFAEHNEVAEGISEIRNRRSFSRSVSAAGTQAHLAPVQNTSQYNYLQDRNVATCQAPNVHNRSLQVLRNAKADPLEYVMKYFSIKADEADLADVEHLADDVETFREIAAWARRELENFDDLEHAAAVQRQLLPRALGDVHGYTVCALYLPANAVGGDFYDHYLVRDGAVFTVADVMGKGLGAAILAASVRSALRVASRVADLTSDSHDVVGFVNSVAAELADDLASTDTFVTLFHAKLDFRDGRVDYVDAGHGVAAVLRPGGGVQHLNSGDLPVGVLPGDKWTPAHVILQPGETLVIASDGALELVGDGADMRPVQNNPTQPTDPAELCEIARSLHARMTLLDDVTLVAIRRDAL